MEWWLILLVVLITFVWNSLPKESEDQAKHSKNPARLKLQELFSIDLRSLALFRICLALSIITELSVAASELVDFYSDEGPTPRSLAATYTNIFFVSLHMISGRKEIIALLFLLAFIFAVAMLVGYRTKLTTFISWFLYISLINRNPLIVEIGDYILKLGLFFSMFLPLGACYSIDSALNNSNKPIPKSIFSIGTTAYLIQMASMYVFSALLKTKNSEWVDGTALFYVLNLLTVTTPFAQKLLQTSVSNLKLLTLSVVKFEFYGPFLLFSPFLFGPIRTALFFVFALLYINFGLFLDLENITYIGITVMIPFLPGWFWDKVSERIKKRNEATATKIYFDGDCGFCKKLVLIIKTFLMIPDTPHLIAQSESSVKSAMELNNSWVVVNSNGSMDFKFKAFISLIRLSPVFSLFTKVLEFPLVSSIGNLAYEYVSSHRKDGAVLTALFQYRPLNIKPLLISNIFATFCLVYIFALNIATIDDKKKIFLEKSYWLGNLLRIDQRWGMFTSSTGWFSGWFVVQGRLNDGSEVDVIRNSEKLSWEIPPALSADYKNRLWRRYLVNVISDPLYINCLPNLSDYLCKKWNSSHAKNKQLEEMVFYFMKHAPTLTNKNPPAEKMTAGRRFCVDRNLTAQELINDIFEKFPDNKNLCLLELYRAASDYWGKGKSDDSELIYEKAVELHEELYGKENPSFVNALNILIAVYNTRKKTDKAEYVKNKYFNQDANGQKKDEN